MTAEEQMTLDDCMMSLEVFLDNQIHALNMDKEMIAKYQAEIFKTVRKHLCLRSSDD